MRHLPALALLALLAACGAPSYYLPPALGGGEAGLPVGSIVVADVSVPTYVEALEIAALTGPRPSTSPKRSLWADTPPTPHPPPRRRPRGPPRRPCRHRAPGPPSTPPASASRSSSTA